MSWLNLNQSFNSLKGQITNFASEVLSEVPEQDSMENALQVDSTASELENKCRKQELEIASFKKLTEELQASLQAERLSKQNGVREDEGSWYWDPPPQNTKLDENVEHQYKVQIRALQDEISTLKERDTIDLRPDTEEELHRLKEENLNLTRNLEDLDNQHQQATERLLSLKKELQQNFEVLKQDHEDLKNSNNEYSVENKMLLEKIGQRDKEVESMKTVISDYDTLQHKYQNLERIYGLLRENAEKFQEENQELHEEIFKLQEEVTKLEHELEIATKNTDFSETVPKHKYEELLKELDSLKDRRNANLMHHDEVNIDDNAKSVIEHLKRDINDLKHRLAIQEGDTQDNADHKFIKSEKVMQLYNKYVNFDIPLDYVGEIPSAGDNIVLYKLESVFKTVNSFKKEIDNLDHQLSEKSLNINHLQTQIDDLTTENDFLTTDIQHFEQELNEMKKNNDFLISEIAALKNVSKLEPIIESHEDNLAKLETELDVCSQMNRTFESEIMRIEKELAEVNSEKNALQESLNDMKTKYTTMLSEIDMCKNKTEAVEELEISVHNQEIEKLKKIFEEMDDLKNRLNAANSKNEQMSIDIHIIENDKVLLTKKVDDLSVALEEKTSSLNELEALKLALDHKLHEFEGKLDEIMKNKNEVEVTKQNLQEKVTALENQLASSNKASSEIERLTAERSLLVQKLSQAVKENSTLVSQIQSLQSREQDLVNQNNSLKAHSKGDATHSESTSKEAKDPCVVKLVQQQDLHKEITSLQQENHKLNQKNAQLEMELSSTDAKILHLDEEFTKLTSDINEKDEMIDELNAAIHESKLTIFNLNKTVNELEQSLVVKNEELERLRLRAESLSSQVVNVRERYNQTQEELHIVRDNSLDAGSELSELRDEMNFKNSEISALSSRLQDTERIRDKFQGAIADKDKEIKELTQSISELNEKFKTNHTHQNDDYGKLVLEKEVIEKELTELKANLMLREQEIDKLKLKSDLLEKEVIGNKSVIDTANAEKTELINLINLKHNESIQYHNEIQRLNHVILEQNQECKRIVDEKDTIIQSNSDNCGNCERLRITLKEKDDIIINLTNKVSDYDRLKTELHNASEVVRNLTERCDNLDKNLATQLDLVKKLTAEKLQLSEVEQSSTKELERLRRHLVDTEENYTQELMASEQKLTECQARLHQVEERAKQTSTVYTSNSIRANQEVETLRNQIKLLEKQREDVQAKLSEAEDARSRSEAALTNLQIVLEQFTLEKDREVLSATEKLRNKMDELRRQNHGSQEEITRLNTKLEEALAGLQAATRLGDQLETKTAQINDLKEQVRTLQTSVTAAEERYHNAISNQQDKVDKNLVKNLLVNYVMTPGGNSTTKTQVLRILSTVLDFNQRECERLGLVRPTTTDRESLAEEFVKFLHNETMPKATLSNVTGMTSSRSTTPVSRKSSTAGPPHPVSDPSHKRNPSTGSNNLLFTNLENVETSSQVSRDSIELRSTLDTGVTQTRNNEGAILKHVLRDI